MVRRRCSADAAAIPVGIAAHRPAPHGTADQPTAVRSLVAWSRSVSIPTASSITSC